MPYEIMKTGEGKGFVMNTKTGRHLSNSPIPLANAEKQLAIVRRAEDSESESGSDMERKDPPKRKFIQEVVSSPKFRKGVFTAKAKKHGMSSLEFMKKVLANPEDYDVTTRRQAQFLQNIQ